MTDKQIQRIQKRIKFLRGRLTAEKRQFGGYHDGAGIRYVIPELYMQIMDFKGAMYYFRWFAKTFPDDIGFPAFNLFWSMTLFHNNKIDAAIKKAYETAFSNTYLIDLIYERNPKAIDKSETMGFESIDYAKEVYQDCVKLMTLEFQTWLSYISDTDDFKANMNRFISLQKLIEDEPVGKMRTHLIDESTKFEKATTGR